ncbi:MAG: hypothetical protein JJU11_00790 [Candidatus Sumerlaeia bacterium]|nr:hypothetical protein [Candidatus Sumerlaeia bacterium]
MLHYLHHLGWTLTSISDPAPLPGLPGNIWQTTPLPDGQHLLLVQSGAALPLSDQAYARYEDLTSHHRELHRVVTHEGIGARLALLSDPLKTVQLLDLEREEVLLEVHGEEEISASLLPLLNLDQVARGSLHSFPRKSLQRRAMELADWSKIWMAQIGPPAGVNRDGALQFLFWVFLCRHAELLGIGPKASVPFHYYGVGAKASQPVRFLTGRFSHLREKWNLLQGASMETQKMVARATHQQGLLSDCLESFARVSRGKISAEVFAEAFADEELRRIGWRHSLVEKPESAEEGPERWLAGPMTLDLDAVGFGGLLRQFDHITEDIREFAREQSVSFERGERPGVQLDLLGNDVAPFEEEDAPRVVLQKVLRVSTRSRSRAEAARLVLLARAAEWHARLMRPHLIFPVPHVEMMGEVAPKQPQPWPTINPSLN